MRYRLSSILFMIAVLGHVGLAEALQLGDEAPPLRIADWVRGDGIDLKSLRGKRIVVLEFWATWCPPCRESIPHLSALQNRFKEQVIIIGITAEPISVVRSFVERMGAKMNYTVAVDQREATSAAYLGALGVNGIPYACVIDRQGRLAWHGSPMGGLDDVLAKLVAGKYDLEAAIRADQARRLLNDYFNAHLIRLPAALTPGERREITEEAVKIGAAILDLGRSDPELLTALAWNILNLPGLEHRDLDLAVRAAEQAFLSLKPPDNSLPENRPLATYAADTFARALWLKNMKQEAVEIEKHAVAWAPDEELARRMRATLREYERTAPPATRPATTTAPS